MGELSLPDSSLGRQDPSLGAEDSAVVQLLNHVSLRPHGLQQARLLCPSPSTGACSNSCPSSRWCLPATSSSVIPFSSCLQSFPASGSYSSESALRIRWPKYWSFSLSISPFSEFSGLISFRLDWFDLLAVQGTLKCLFQLHSQTASSVPSFSFCSGSPECDIEWGWNGPPMKTSWMLSPFRASFFGVCFQTPGDTLKCLTL